MKNNNHKDKFFRAGKTTPGNDDFKVLMVGVVLACLILVVSIMLPAFHEYRWYRDFASLTPFDKVVLTETSVSEDGTKIQISGTMRKLRCTFDFDVKTNPVGYVTGQYNQRHRVPVDTSPEDIKTGVSGGSRPPSKDIEVWGPWEIDVTGLTVFDEDLNPKRFEVQVFHKDCPDNPKKQVNEFVKGNWGNFLSERPGSER